MSKLRAARVNVGYTNVSSVSDYYSDNADFVGLKSTSYRDNGASNRTDKVSRTTIKTENTNGLVTQETSKESYKNINTFGGVTSFTNSGKTESDFLLTTGSKTFLNYTSASLNNYVQSRNISRGSTSNRMLRSSSSTGSTSFSASQYSSKLSRANPDNPNDLRNTGYTLSGNTTGYTKKTVTYSSLSNTTIQATSSKFEYSIITRSTHQFLITDDQGAGTSQTDYNGDNGDDDDVSPTPVTDTRNMPRTRRATTLGTYAETSYSARVPSTFVSESTVTLTNKSNLESTFSYTLNVTTWTESSTFEASTFEPTNFTVETVDMDDSTQQVVSSIYELGGVRGYIPLNSLDGITLNFDGSDLTSSFSIFESYLPDRNAHSEKIEVGSNENDVLTYEAYSYVPYPDGTYSSSTSTVFTYTTQTLSNIVTTETTISGSFSFGKTDTISTQYTFSEDEYLDYTNLSTSERESPIETIITAEFSNCATVMADDINNDITASVTYYNYSSDVSSTTQTNFVYRTSRMIGFLEANQNAGYTSTYFVINREKINWFSVVGGGFPFIGDFSLITKDWGGLNGFQTDADEKKITGIPTIGFTDEYITTSSKDISEIIPTTSDQQTTTSAGSTTINTINNIDTTTLSTYNVNCNTTEDTEYDMPLYDTSYKLNRYYTFIPTSGKFKYIAEASSFESTGNSISATNTFSGLFLTDSDDSPVFSYSKTLHGLRQIKSFGDITTREIPKFYTGYNLTNPFAGERFTDESGTLFFSKELFLETADYFPISILTDTASTDYLTIDMSGNNAISQTIPSNKILRVKNTHGIIKQQLSYEYFNYNESGGNPSLGNRYYMGAEQRYYPIPVR